MGPLATVEDLEARLGRELTPAEEARAEALLADASALVRAWTRQSFAPVEDDELVLRPVGTELRLPQRPVTAVSSVRAVSGLASVPDLALPGWTWDGIDIVDIAGIDSHIWVSLPAWWEDWGAAPNTYRVVYSHGTDAVPAVVVAVVCQMVLRTLTAPSMTEGLVSEKIGQYNYQMQQSTGSAGAAVRMTPDDKATLASAGWRRSSTTVQVRG